MIKSKKRGGRAVRGIKRRVEKTEVWKGRKEAVKGVKEVEGWKWVESTKKT